MGRAISGFLYSLSISFHFCLSASLLLCFSAPLLLPLSGCGGDESGTDEFDALASIAPSSSLIGDWDLRETMQDANCSELIRGMTNGVQITITESKCQLHLDADDVFSYSDGTGCTAGGNDLQVIIKATLSGEDEDCTLSGSETIKASLDAKGKMSGTFTGSMKTSGKCTSEQKINCKYSGTVLGNKDDLDEVDSDGDGFDNGEDNCPYHEEADQTDADADGQGDVCDSDIDGDGLFEYADNCEYTSNPDQRDSDYDRVGDACDDELVECFEDTCLVTCITNEDCDDDYFLGCLGGNGVAEQGYGYCVTYQQAKDFFEAVFGGLNL